MGESKVRILQTLYYTVCNIELLKNYIAQWEIILISILSRLTINLTRLSLKVP